MILSYFVQFISTDTVMKVIHLHLFYNLHLFTRLCRSFVHQTQCENLRTAQDEWLQRDYASSITMRETMKWIYFKGNLGVKLPTIWKDEKQRREE